MNKEDTLVIERAEHLWRPGNRRNFLRVLGLGGTVVLLPSVFACSDDNSTNTTSTSVSLKLSDDVGILNYAYALEQLEAGYYSAVLASAAFAGLTTEVKEVLTDLRNHEVIHREFFRAVLGSSAIGDLSLNATAVASATANATVILQTSEALEDTGVSAYNGAGKYLTSADNLTIAGKIVSVEARHAAAIRDIRDALGITAGASAGTRFAGDDVVGSSGLDVKLEPSAVLSRVAGTGLVSTSISIGTQPPTKAGTPDAGPPSPTP